MRKASEEPPSDEKERDAKKSQQAPEKQKDDMRLRPGVRSIDTPPGEPYNDPQYGRS